MCKILKISRASVYYQAKPRKDDEELVETIKEVFKASRNNYGTRKIKVELSKRRFTVSRRRIGRIMADVGLVSNYTVKQYKVSKSEVNEEPIKNVVNREFNERLNREVVVSDLTYVRVANTWHYICVLLDLSNREIIGYSAGAHKTAELVKQAFLKIDGSLDKIKIFHTDRGSEFKNQVIDEILEMFEIKRSLSAKGTPLDNAVAEATYKVLKTEFTNQMHFESLEQLNLELFDYVNWYNNIRIHGSLGYITPVNFRKLHFS